MDKIEKVISTICVHNKLHHDESYTIELVYDMEPWELEKLCFNLLNLPPYKQYCQNAMYFLMRHLDKCNDLGIHAYRWMVIYSILITHLDEAEDVHYTLHSMHKEHPSFVDQHNALTLRGIL